VRRITILLFLSVFCFTTVMQAQAPAPKPDPEMKKLHVFVGHWTYEGEAKPGPLGPGGKFAGEYDGQMILGGFFFQGRWTEKGPTGETGGLEIDWYDPVNKNLVGNCYLSEGNRLPWVFTVAGNTYTFAGKLAVAGKQYQYKGTFTFAPDLASATLKEEISVDSKTWTPLRESQWTKAKPAPKK
jgi:hypothetical protein